MLTKAEIVQIRSLSAKKERVAAGLFVAEGEKLVRELLVSDFNVRRIFACATAGGNLHTGGVAVETVSAKEMERISMLKTPSEVLALVEIPRYPTLGIPKQGDLVIALDNVQDPGNMGTIIRLADWFGVRDIVCSEGTADCFNPKVVQATMGAISRVRVHYTGLAAFLEKAAGAGRPLYGTFLEGEPIYKTELSPGGILIMGNEGNGVSDEVARLVTRKLYIPPFPEGNPSSESLNVAVATAIVCSEFRRR